MRTLLATLGVLCLFPCAVAARAPHPPQAVVEVEEDVYRYEPAENGAGPMWCRGSTCLVRVGDAVFASGLETFKGARPLNNCRWTFHKRGATGWERQQTDPSGACGPRAAGDSGVRGRRSESAAQAHPAPLGRSADVHRTLVP